MSTSAGVLVWFKMENYGGYGTQGLWFLSLCLFYVPYNGSWNACSK